MLFHQHLWLDYSSHLSVVGGAVVLSLFAHVNYTVFQKTPPYYFLDNSVKNKLILTIFGTQNFEEI